ncbi:MAG: hypothetical protein K940chlam1_01190 [Candidatus Anoxychlamydiales bacterium]|nr:hypothetical protein [Candidatus Anoxychlamydiales bacterium]NGX36118.1 hypothetical protein [Candidatus Anoxychlamydiales bacterium]
MHQKATPPIDEKKKICFADFKLEEVPTHIIHFAICAKKFTVLFLILFMAFFHLKFTLFPFIIIFSISFFFYQIFIVAFSAWTKLERLHKIIEDKKWHIEHKREEEKMQLEEIYKAKGFSGKTLQDIIDTLISDDNTLLRAMLQEEMGLSLGSYIHPIKQTLGSALGMIYAALVFTIFYFVFPINYNFFIAGGFTIITSSIISAKYERTKISKEIIWDLAISFVVILISHFLSLIFVKLFNI